MSTKKFVAMSNYTLVDGKNVNADMHTLAARQLHKMAKSLGWKKVSVSVISSFHNTRVVLYYPFNAGFKLTWYVKYYSKLITILTPFFTK